MEKRLWLVLLLFLLGAYLSVRYLLPLIFPFALGFIISGLVEPVVRWFEERLHISRRIATGFIYGIFLTCSAFLLLWAISSATHEIQGLLREWPILHRVIESLIDWLHQQLPNGLQKVPPELQTALAEAIDRLVALLTRFVMELAGNLEKIPQIIGTMALSWVAAFFLTRDKDYWILWIKRLIPLSFMKTAKCLTDDLTDAVFRMVRMEILLMASTFLFSGLTFMALGCSRPWFLGLVAGILEPLPMVGPAAFLLPWSGFLLATGHWGDAIILLLLCAGIMFARQWGELRFLGRHLGLHPLLTLFGITVGLKCFGMVGIWLGPMILMILRSLLIFISKENLRPDKESNLAPSG